MSRNTSRNPKSYEEIVRETVVDPDSSVRPTLDQERAAREGFRAVDSSEQALHEKIIHALATSSADVAGVTVEVTRDLVTLRGRVPDATTLRVLEDVVASVPGVTTVHDQVVIGPATSP